MRFFASLVLVVSSLLFTSCAAIAPGNDPLIVRAEQTETIAASAFDTVVILDNSNRGFWMTNAPAYHAFCEWLRTPIVIESNIPMRRGLAMIKLVDDDKLIYKSNASQSNILIQALADLSSIVQQAQSWTVIVQTPTR